jgi:hypothetical protein
MGSPKIGKTAVFPGKTASVLLKNYIRKNEDLGNDE